MYRKSVEMKLETIPIFNPVSGQIIKKPHGNDEGYWVGASKWG